MFAKEGYPFIITAAVLVIVFLVLPKWLLVVVSILLLAQMLWFFRDPERLAPHDENAIVSAADGRIVEIAETTYNGKKYKKVSVFMNLFSVHVNRVPFGGTVESIRHIAGGFINADKPEASLSNERNEITINTACGKMVIVQVAGLVARRTVAYVDENTEVAKGDRLGMIKFSSRVDHYLPLNVNVEVAFGMKVKAGESIIASC